MPAADLGRQPGCGGRPAAEGNPASRTQLTDHRSGQGDRGGSVSDSRPGQKALDGGRCPVGEKSDLDLAQRGAQHDPRLLPRAQVGHEEQGSGQEQQGSNHRAGGLPFVIPRSAPGRLMYEVDAVAATAVASESMNFYRELL